MKIVVNNSDRTIAFRPLKPKMDQLTYMHKLTYTII